ncbi:MAG: zinc-ribbon domain-containing protein [Promethearchaeota archaeon]
MNLELSVTIVVVIVIVILIIVLRIVAFFYEKLTSGPVPAESEITAAGTTGIDHKSATVPRKRLDPEKKIFCTNCGWRGTINDEFCGSCGARLYKGESI